MGIVVVGGHSRNIGKTSVAAALIAAFPQKNWTAVKVTQYGHGICSMHGRRCTCAVDEHRYAIVEETDRSSKKDSSRFLAAGAARSFWVRVKQGQLELAMPELRRIVDSAPFVMIESNTILNFVQPDLYLTVLSYEVEDFKASARELLRKADAAVVVESRSNRPAWHAVSQDMLAGIPIYRVAAPAFVSAGLIAFVRSRLNVVG